MASTKKSALAVNATVDLTVMNTEIFINYRSFEQQAPSSKPQAKVSSSEQQASSPEQRASSNKPRASSSKISFPS
jgi:hypothetical protein